MKINNLILHSFDFLANSGFKSEYNEFDNIVFINSFVHENECEIVVSVNLREHYVDLKIKKATKVLLTIEYGEVMKNFKFGGLEDLLIAVEKVYKESKRRYYGFSKPHITAICGLYADFIKMNFDNIMNA